MRIGTEFMTYFNELPTAFQWAFLAPVSAIWIGFCSWLIWLIVHVRDKR